VSRNQRIGLIAAAIVVAVVAFLIASPGGDDDEQTSTRPSATAPQTDTETPTGTQTVTETSKQTTPEARPAPPQVARISLSGGVAKGGPRTIKVRSGDTVRIAVSSDASDEIHIHGYDLTKTAAPGQPATFRFKASIEGDFEIESHTAEDAGKEPLIARLQVAPG
jgi:FtsP/CotA-like multicopper oxidase with cupredoxin domain